jgi:hypothetical protein
MWPLPRPTSNPHLESVAAFGFGNQNEEATLTLSLAVTTIPQVRAILRSIAAATIVAVLGVGGSGCGVAYQAGTRIKASHMADSIQAGQSSSEIHARFGEPAIRQYLPGETEIWSYPYKPNSNDIVAGLLYTSTKEGDKGTFLDLKFINAKLVSWQEAEHTMPSKERSGFSAGLGGGGITGGPGNASGAHY